MPKLDNDFRENFERKEGEKVFAKCKSCKLAATPAPNKTGKSYFHSGNLMQHLKRKHPRTAWNVDQTKRSIFICSVFKCHLIDAFVTVMRSAEKGHLDYTIDVSDFKKAVVDAVTLNRLPLSVFEASGIKKILLQLFVLYWFANVVK